MSASTQMRWLLAGRATKIRREEQILPVGRYDGWRTGPSGCRTSVVPVVVMRLKAGG
jgi:hypothetical protein